MGNFFGELNSYLQMHKIECFGPLIVRHLNAHPSTPPPPLRHGRHAAKTEDGIVFPSITVSYYR